ncbi:hypothetical protein FPCIR_12447 [Fusarium pseudocircinatum]|uniref:Uncharacterized protein n=1 Tax=Fusarium pseudocircinatum TaxID=56676 RepID=A0A8H5NSR6_9HYPO|nr:hypothetical protein FPCIR_12447 [Fusarium pseudocircinatum]
MASRDEMGESDAPLRKFHWNFVVDEEEEWRACSDYLLELFREDLKRKRDIGEEEEEKKKKEKKKPRLFFRRWSAPLAPVLSAVPVVAAPAITDERAVAVLAAVQKRLSARRKRAKKPKPKPEGDSILQEMMIEMKWF